MGNRLFCFQEGIMYFYRTDRLDVADSIAYSETVCTYL